MASKTNKLFDDEDKDELITISKGQFEALLLAADIKTHSVKDEAVSYGERLGFLIIIGLIFCIGMFIGWKWEHSSLCSSYTSYTLSCLDGN